MMRRRRKPPIKTSTAIPSTLCSPSRSRRQNSASGIPMPRMITPSKSSTPQALTNARNTGPRLTKNAIRTMSSRRTTQPSRRWSAFTPGIVQRDLCASSSISEAEIDADRRRGSPHARARRIDAALLGKCAHESDQREEPEDRQRPRAERHRRPRLEHRLERIRLDQHVPEAQRPMKIERQQNPAEHDARKGDVITEARERTIRRPAEEVDHHGDEIAAA